MAPEVLTAAGETNRQRGTDEAHPAAVLSQVPTKYKNQYSTPCALLAVIHCREEEKTHNLQSPNTCPTAQDICNLE